MHAGWRFVASPDKRYLYDIYYHYVREQWYVLRFSLNDLTVSKAVIEDCLRLTVDIYTDEDGILYALQTQHLTDDGKISQNGILRIDWRTETPIFSWMHMWQSEREKRWLCTDGRYIMCCDYTVIDMKYMQSFSLLENDSEWKTELGCSDCVYLPDRGLLIAYHTMYDGNVVIDTKARKRVAQYAPPKLGVAAGYAGCLIGDEYWIGTEGGIVKKTFPVFEEVSRDVSPYWLWAKEMEKIRGEELSKKYGI